MEISLPCCVCRFHIIDLLIIIYYIIMEIILIVWADSMMDGSGDHSESRIDEAFLNGSNAFVVEGDFDCFVLCL